jgi:hypothetical protein
VPRKHAVKKVGELGGSGSGPWCCWRKSQFVEMAAVCLAYRATGAHCLICIHTAKRASLGRFMIVIA